MSVWLGWTRVGVFCTGFALYVVWDVTSGGVARASLAGMAASVLLFLLLVIWHRRVRVREKWLGTLVRLNEMGLARLDRDWDALPVSPLEDPPIDHPYAADLDLAGDASLFRLFSTVTLPPGIECLRNWLLAPAPPKEILQRQEAVSELASRLDFRQTLEAHGRLDEGGPRGSFPAFLEWAESESWLADHPWIYRGAWLLPLLTFVLVLPASRGTLGGSWWALSALATIVLASAHRKVIHRQMDQASAGRDELSRYAAILSQMEEMEVDAAELRELKDAVMHSPVGAPGELLRLGRRMGWADIRLSPMAHGFFQAIFAWDIHTLAGLESWRSRCGHHVRDWLDALGTLEALAALAALKADNPVWSFPRIEEGEAPCVEATDMGHPLLAETKCVGNDVSVGPPGSFLFLTGSNMSGKSTLLRAMGSNVVLAHAGGPVCAREMSLTPLQTRTSMRTSDSLAEGISQYMAELNRIRRVVAGAKEGGGLPTLFLVDEPLQGTNEAERREAVQTILGHLLDAGAIGAVATHDLFLDNTPRLESAARAVHLEGQVAEEDDGPILSFDYRLRPGRATSTNALALLRAVGLGQA